jgi:hypothetical protein
MLGSRLCAGFRVTPLRVDFTLEFSRLGRTFGSEDRKDVRPVRNAPHTGCLAIDTNVLVYRVDPRNPAKQRIARDFLSGPMPSALV